MYKTGISCAYSKHQHGKIAGYHGDINCHNINKLVIMVKLMTAMEDSQSTSWECGCSEQKHQWDSCGVNNQQ